MTRPDLEPSLHLQRRRPVWDALSKLFLDTELDDEERRRIGETIVASGYSPAEIQTILWDELFPVVECNLRDFLGEWAAFDLDWLQQQILSGRHRRTFWVRIASMFPWSPARMVRQEWNALVPFLPEHFRQGRPSAR